MTKMFRTDQKITIFYFSGTGNAKRIAQWYSEFAAMKGVESSLYDIANCKNLNLTSLIENRLIFIISPIHGFNYPKITLDFISHFPKGNNRIVLMNTRAGMKIGKFITPGLTGIAFIIASILLRLKGYNIVGQIPYDMPSNWLSLHPALNEKSIKFLHQKNINRVEKDSDTIFSGKTNFKSYRDLIQDILISPIAFGYYFIGRFAIAKTFYASAACDMCGKCIKQCPVNAIKNINNHPFWTFKCESCMHCMNICHKRAIETAHGLIIIVSILSSLVFTLFIESILKIDIESSWIRMTIWSLFFMVIIWVMYYLQHFLLRFKLISKLITLTSLTHYKFWGRYLSSNEKFTPEKK